MSKSKRARSRFAAKPRSCHHASLLYGSRTPSGPAVGLGCIQRPEQQAATSEVLRVIATAADQRCQRQSATGIGRLRAHEEAPLDLRITSDTRRAGTRRISKGGV